MGLVSASLGMMSKTVRLGSAAQAAVAKAGELEILMAAFEAGAKISMGRLMVIVVPLATSFKKA